jgi:Fe-S-cluster containining protein
MTIPELIRPQVIELFDQMDRAYDSAARKSGFVCNGCKDNCCMTRFYHYTLLEYLYLKSGIAKLAPDGLEKVRAQAGSALEQMAKLEQTDNPIRVMCPLNKTGRCLVYTHRPMICRLHGIPHALRRPDGQLQSGPGCDDFYAQCGASTENHLDRTPLYIAMAKLEQQLRKDWGYNAKIKMTIAEIVLDDRLL